MEKVERIIGDFKTTSEGPLLFIIGGIHGNEPAGVKALERVFAELEEKKPHFRGRFIGLRGNCVGLAQGVRYIDRDLNRLWSEEAIAEAKAKSMAERNSEEKELLSLLRLIEAAVDTPYEPKVFVDLHTTSAPGGLFSIVTDQAENRELAEALHAPIVFNLVDELALTTNKFFENRNLSGLAFESGQHDDEASIDNAEGAIWLLLEKAGCIDRAYFPELNRYEQVLTKASAHLSPYMEVSYRHPITHEDHFKMNSGYVNFQSINEGESIGHDHKGPVSSPNAGLMLMPLYQKQGEDGFFIINELDRPPV